MDHRERVMMAFAHEEPDRVPLDLWGSAYSLTDPVYFDLKRELNIQSDIEPFRRQRMSTYYDERVLEALDIDFRHVRLARTSAKTDSSSALDRQDETFLDPWGVTIRLVNMIPVATKHPLAEATIDQLEDYPWPSGFYSAEDELAFVQQARHYQEETAYAVIARTPVSLGIFETAGDLRGTVQFLIDLLIDKPFAHRLLEHVVTVIEGVYDHMLREAGRYVNVVQVAADYGTQTSLFISPETYREMIKPHDAKLIGCIRERAPQAKVMWHSCGAVFPLIQDLIDAGVDIINPLQPLAKGMDSERVKKTYGDKVILHGAIDIQHALPGTPEGLRREVEKRIRDLAPGGGYVLAPSNDVMPDVPGKNIVLLYQWARELGRYPISF
jgi:uroporphyrinogen decarboxylase